MSESKLNMHIARSQFISLEVESSSRNLKILGLISRDKVLDLHFGEILG